MGYLIKTHYWILKREYENTKSLKCKKEGV